MEISEVFEGLRRRWEELGLAFPISCTADNCCQVEAPITQSFPDIRVLLDIFHEIRR